MDQEDKKHEIELEKWKFLSNLKKETGFSALDQTFQEGQSTTKSAILLNGGAAIAMLAFIGHLFNSPDGILIAKKLSYALVAFSLGTFSAVMSICASYISHEIALNYLLKTRENKKNTVQIPWWKKIWNKIFFALLFLSYVLFLYGLYLAYSAINS